MNALAAWYDTLNNRVVLIVTTEENIGAVTIWRHESGGFIHAVQNLTAVPTSSSGKTTLFDYTAPLNRTHTYQAMLYCGAGDDLDAVYEPQPITAEVTTTYAHKPYFRKLPKDDE